MKRITIDEYKTRVPSSNDGYFNGLTSEEQETYLTMYSVYSSLLADYFIKNFKLNEYDEALLESPYPFPKLKEEDMDIYQYRTSDKLTYFYIRNNLFMERLDEEEQRFLIDKCQEEDLSLDEKTEEFITSTFKKVMLENPTDEDSVNICFGPDNKNFMVPDNAIVMGIRYDDYEKLPGESSEEWVETHNKRLQDIEALSILIEIRLSRASGVKTVAIKYNDFSIKKKETIETNIDKKVI